MTTNARSNKSPDTLVREAIDNTDHVYWRTLCSQRAERSPECTGSYYKRLDHLGVDGFIRDLSWELYTHVAVREPATAFLARGTPNGVLNIIDASCIPTDVDLKFEDPKNTGFVEAVWETTQEPKFTVDHTVLIVGPHPETGKPVVYTFHPGDPVRPSVIKRVVEVYEEIGGEGKTVRIDRHASCIRVDLARELGVVWVKCRRIPNL